MKHLLVIAAAFLVLGSHSALAAHAGSSSCDKIAKACKDSGFKVFKDAAKATKSGNELWGDCFCPIAQGKAQPATSKQALPSVQSLTAQVAQCKAAPKYMNKCN